MSSEYRNGELGTLVGAMCDGTITADETGRLDALLSSDEDARQFYNNYMFLHAELYSQHASVEAVEIGKDLGLHISDTESERAGASSPPSEDKPQPASQEFALRGRRWGWIAVAAALVGVA